MLDYYKVFIDGLAERAVSADPEIGRVWGSVKDMARNMDIEGGSQQFRQALLREIFTTAWRAGMCSALEYLDSQMLSAGLRMWVGNGELPCRPFMTEMAFDWRMRCAGLAWPDKDSVEIPPGLSLQELTRFSEES